MHVLLGNELGGGLGHAAILLPIARRLVDGGARVTLAMPRPDLLAAAGVALRPAPPLSSPPRIRKFQMRTFDDLLLELGFADIDVVRATTRGWLDLIRELKADLVVANHAPFLALAAYGARPCVVVGTGFEVPPPRYPFPPLEGALDPGGTAPGAQIAANVDQILRERGIASPDHPGALCPVDSHFVVSIAELDPYRWHRSLRQAGPLEPLPRRQPSRGELVFAYLGPDAFSFERIVRGLGATGLPTLLVARPAAGAPRVRVARNITLAPHPIPLAEVMGDAGLIVHHGGLSLTQAALLSGIPQMILPRFDEQRLTAAAVEQLGAGVWYTDPEAALVHRKAEELFHDVSLRSHVSAIGNRLDAQWPGGAADRIVAHCNKLAGDRSASTLTV